MQGRIKRSPDTAQIVGVPKIINGESFWIFQFIDITINHKFYEIYQTHVWVLLEKILMLTTNFYFDYEIRSKKLSPICYSD